MTPSLALIFSPSARLSTYLSYSEALQKGPTAPSTAANANETLAPYLSRQIELGAKSTFSELDVNVALFRIEKANAQTDPQTNLYSEDGREVHWGGELVLAGRASRELTVGGGLSLLHAYVDKASTASLIGKVPQGVPERTARFFAEYSPLWLPGPDASGWPLLYRQDLCRCGERAAARFGSDRGHGNPLPEPDRRSRHDVQAQRQQRHEQELLGQQRQLARPRRAAQHRAVGLDGFLRSPSMSQSLLRQASALLALLAAFALPSPSHADASRQIIDMSGRTVRVPAEVHRAVGTGGAVDEWFLLLGSGHKLVATSDAIRKNPWFRKIYPDIARVPIALGSDGASAEALLAAHPDVVILLANMEAQSIVGHTGIPVIVLERRNFDELKQAIDIAAKVLGPQEEKAAARFRRYFDANLNRVQAKTARLSRQKRVRVFYAGARPFSTEGADTLVDAWIRVAGGANVAGEHGVSGMGKTVSPEDLVRWNPEVIIAMSPAVRDEILKSPALKDLAAIRSGRVFVNPKGVYSWGVRSADEALQVLWAAKTLHPELFAEIDLIAEVKRFHRLFYRFELTDADVRRMLAGLPPD